MPFSEIGNMGAAGAQQSSREFRLNGISQPMALERQLRTLVALTEDSGLIPRTHMVVHSHLQLQTQGTGYLHMIST
ncbi:hypothetical protein ACQP3F_30825, partial [Escherichia coli]